MPANALNGNAPSRCSLRVHSLVKRYSRRGGSAKGNPLMAVEDVTFSVAPGETLALVGSSGSGKSTLARCVARLEMPDAGEIWLGDRNIAQLSRGDLLPYRHLIQMIFQDPITSMHPTMSAGDIIAEPLVIQHRLEREARRLRAQELMCQVGLPSTSIERRASEFSGGQRQRLAIARGLALHPQIMILDEALSGLDLSTRAQIANLLVELQQTHTLAYLLISHDLTLVSRMADRVAIMARGKIVEEGPTAQLFGQPQHPETKALLATFEPFALARAAAQAGAR